MAGPPTAKPITLLKSEYKLMGRLGSGGFSLVYLVQVSYLGLSWLCYTYL